MALARHPAEEQALHRVLGRVGMQNEENVMIERIGTLSIPICQLRSANPAGDVGQHEHALGVGALSNHRLFKRAKETDLVLPVCRVHVS